MPRTGARPTALQEAVDNAWQAARAAERLDSSGRYAERDAEIKMANMWSMVAMAEAAKEMTPNVDHG